MKRMKTSYSVGKNIIQHISGKGPPNSKVKKAVIQFNKMLEEKISLEQIDTLEDIDNLFEKAIRKMQIKTTMSYYCKPIRMAVIKYNDNKCL